MKIVLIILALLTAVPLGAQDCVNCQSGNLRHLSLKVPEWPIEYTTIEKVEYKRNSNANFCKRPVEMVDTIVLHHSETPSTTTPEGINDFHLQRGTPQDPWYMIAYSYTINSPYPGAAAPRMRVTEGRPLDLVGAHAGTGIFVPMDEEQKKLWNEGKIVCGKENTDFKVDLTQLNDKGEIKANVTTIGLVVIGNYSPFSRTNPNGYSPRNPRFPTQATQDQIARLSCQLQKKYPRMKKMRWHNFYHPTSCPGTIRDFVARIRALARRYGCEFN